MDNLDIYFDEKYVELYEHLPEKKCIKFFYKDEYGSITNIFIKRKIPIQSPDNEQYYDIITPYGYGGPIITELNEVNNKNKLIENYIREFEKYSKQERIVSEFIRFHPILNNAQDFNYVFDTSFNRETVGTNLTFEDPFQSEFSKSARKNIRKILKNPHITFKIIENPDDLNDFQEIYYSTMDRNEATSEYYFSEDYFNKMQINLKNNLVVIKVLFDSKIIGMSLNFKYGKLLHAHLSGTLNEYLSYSPAYILKYALMDFGKKNGFDLIHYGGGKNSSTDDNLYKFKKKFGQNTKFDFYIGKKIWNQRIYNLFCEHTETKSEINFFPAYRKV